MKHGMPVWAICVGALLVVTFTNTQPGRQGPQPPAMLSEWEMQAIAGGDTSDGGGGGSAGAKPEYCGQLLNQCLSGCQLSFWETVAGLVLSVWDPRIAAAGYASEWGCTQGCYFRYAQCG